SSPPAALPDPPFPLPSRERAALEMPPRRPAATSNDRVAVPLRGKNCQRNSQHFIAGNFSAPTRVIHGEQDLRVPDNHGFRLFNVQRNRGVRSVLVYCPDENRWVLKQKNSIRWHEGVRNGLAEFVGKESRGIASRQAGCRTVAPGRFADWSLPAASRRWPRSVWSQQVPRGVASPRVR